jgi:DNA end-binding protein Ku
MVDSRDMNRVRYERVNEETGEEVPWSDIAKGYEYDSGNYVLLTEEDFEKAAPEATKSVEIESFVEAASIDLRYVDKPYYLEPGKRGAKGYVLLREALRETEKVGVAKVVIHSREHLAALYPHGNALALVLLRFAQEVRDPEALNLPEGDLEDYKVKGKELEMAEDLIESMTEEWNPEQYHDEYREKLLKYIESKVEEGEGAAVSEAAEGEGEPAGEVVDFADLLKKSVERKTGKGTSKKKKSAPSNGKGSSKKKSGGKKEKASGD